MTDPTMVKVDLSDLMDDGVLMAANEVFFWPLGLALTWEVPTIAVDTKRWCHEHKIHPAHQFVDTADTGLTNMLLECAGTIAGRGARNLHITQWQFEDGHVETIELDPKDEVAVSRREAFLEWFEDRLEKLPLAERRLTAGRLSAPIGRIRRNLFDAKEKA